MHQSMVRVLHVERLRRDMAILVLEAPDIASEARPGQFVMVRCGELPLRRPLSIHAACDGKVALLFRLTGSGTTWLSEVGLGARLDMTGPLGRGYTLPEPQGKALLIAGGMGIAPLHFLAARLGERHAITLVYGARCGDDVYHMPDTARGLLSESSRVEDARWLIATDDGSLGTRGSAIELAAPHIEDASHLYLCGPLGMCLYANRLVNAKHDITNDTGAVKCGSRVGERLMAAEVSLEVRMACGVGACYGCSIQTLQGRRKVCTDGPVFRFGDVLWEEIHT